MRVAIVHSFYRSGQPSGENAMVLTQAEGLRDRGHDVRVVARHSDDESGSSLFPLRAAARVVTGHGPTPIPELLQFKPDVVHVHNLFPGFGTDWLAKWTGRLVATLHNFRPLCANGLMFRDGGFCDDCQTKTWFAGARHRCYHDSSLASLPLCIRNSRGLAGDSVIRRADALILLSEAAADIYRKFGVGEDLINVIPNGIAAPETKKSGPREDWIAAGRLSPEKGFLDLARSWPEGRSLLIYGDGPDREALEQLGRDDVHVMGPVPKEQLVAKMARCLGLVFPSLCLDSQPTVVSEALSVATPVVAKSSNSVARLVLAKRCGATYAGAHDISDALNYVQRNFSALAENAVDVFRESLTADRWLDSLESVYSRAAGSGSPH